MFCHALSAQQKDSTVVKPAEVKEESNPAKKKNFVYFISTRISDDDKYDVFKITPGIQAQSLVVIRGQMEIIDNPNQKRAKINVYNVSNNELVGIYNTNQYTGKYLLILAPNVKYLFKVEVSGYGTTQEIIEVPLKIDYEICQQELKIKLNEKQKPVLLINSFFADENEKVFYLKTAVDTTNNGLLASIDENNKAIGKDGKEYSSIDEMVKKQLEEEKKKPEEALKAFKNNDFEKAYTLYSELLQNDHEEPFINYYYGVCLLKLERNKAKAINSLQLASAVKDVPYDVFYYLGKACHLSYLFHDAISALEEYKKQAKPTEISSNKVEDLLRHCKNGITLMTDQLNIEVLKRTTAETENIVSNYDPEIVNEKLKQKTDYFYSSIDKKKQEPFLMFTNNSREFYHVSYGEKDASNTDIYKNVYLPVGTLGSSTSLGPDINTSYDENYPYLSRDGKTLYFSSKGHNSMGGFDIFKCTRFDSLSAWSKPVNMGYPINSVYDDILYIPDPVNQYASYCTNRKNNTLEYTQIKLPQHASAHSIIKGQFSTTDSIPKKDAYINIYNESTGEVAGSYKTNTQTGQYLMVLISGVKYDMTVESEGNPDFNTSFEVPDKKGEFDLKQIIKIQTKLIPKAISVSNYFTEAEAAKISFDPPQVAKITAINTDKTTNPETKKEVKHRKPKRSAEESAKDQDDLKLARNLFDQSTYQEAAIIYNQLNHFIDLEPSDSYNFGICLYNTKKDKTDCITALENAATVKTTPHDVYYYLAKANHMSYRFATAILHYKKFTAGCLPEEAKKLEIDKEINYCKSGIKLVNNPTVLEVYNKRHVGHESIQNSLTEIESGSKILVITDDMRSSIDKKKNFKSLLFLSADKTTVLYTSYGENESNGKDIYQLKKLGNGKWSPTPMNITSVNSTFDEEYPSLSKDGKTLYFSSKGYENMGDYDIFKSVWDESTNTWSKPVNMGSPINSPFEDIYFLE